MKIFLFSHLALSQSKSECCHDHETSICRKVRVPWRVSYFSFSKDKQSERVQTCCQQPVILLNPVVREVLRQAGGACKQLPSQSLKVEGEKKWKKGRIWWWNEKNRQKLAKKSSFKHATTSKSCVITTLQQFCIADTGGRLERHLLEGAQLPALPKIKKYMNKHQNNKKKIKTCIYNCLHVLGVYLQMKTYQIQEKYLIAINQPT